MNVGSGPNVLPGYDNLDLYVDAPGVIRADVRKLPYPDKSVDEVLASDILEHFPRLEWKAVLAEWVRVIKPGGLLVVQAPDMALLAAELLGASDTNNDEDWEKWNRRIFGGQGDGRDDGKGQFHFTGFNAYFLQRHCENKLGLEYVSCDLHNYNFKLQMRKP
ncbi:MAG: class I SAM-dependent methyltransferase [Gemmatimonadota bacterium]